MHEIVPAILETTEKDLFEKVKALPAEINFFHLDVLDQDVWSPDIARQFEVHIMTEHPESVYDLWVKRGARRIISHKLDAELLKHRGEVEVGLAFELDVPIEDVLVLAELSDFVHIMSISEIGAQGHPLDNRVFDRIRAVQEKFPEMMISVDGGITAENYQKLVEAGADRLVIGSHFNEIWNSLKKEL